MMRLRRSEWLLVAYFAYTAVLAHRLPLRSPIPAVALGVNLVVIAGFALLAWAHSLRERRLFATLRDWYPAPLMLLAYREMGWFAPIHHTHQYERTWVGWDRVLLNNWVLLAGYGIHTSVFPGAHVAGVFSAAFAMLRLLPERRWVGRLLLPLAVSIAVATIYGRYHYAADAVAGFAISVAAYWVGVALERRPARR